MNTIGIFTHPDARNPQWTRTNELCYLGVGRFAVRTWESTPANLNPIPRESLYHLRDGVIYWDSNGQYPSLATIREYDMHETPGFSESLHLASERASLDAFLADYRRIQAECGGPSYEERAEARAAHGEGVKLVDVITGRSWTT